VIGCFDMDGVLLDSEHIKLTAWSRAVAEVLNPTLSDLEVLNRYNRRARGIPRITKFEYVLHYLGAHRSQLGSLLDRYELLLADRMIELKPMPGAIEFVSAWPGRRWVVSSAPSANIAGLVSRAGFPPFDRVCGYPTTKVAALSAARRLGTTVYFGDAAADRDAALVADVAFVAIGAVDIDARDLARGISLGDLEDCMPTLLDQATSRLGNTR
jgi:beta-phosphoglucomutase-like phosphatase (HAD superfamily)